MWRLTGYDTFAREWYPLPTPDHPGYATEAEALAAAQARLAKLEAQQPSHRSGGQDGIQDRVYIISPDGQQRRVFPRMPFDGPERDSVRPHNVRPEEAVTLPAPVPAISPHPGLPRPIESEGAGMHFRTSEILHHCTRCGRPVAAYRRSTIAQATHWEYHEEPPGVEHEPHYWCVHCQEHWLAVNAIDTGTSCPRCRDFMPVHASFCGSCGKSLRT